jgi:hypothetical protein
MHPNQDLRGYLTTEALQKGNKPLKVRSALFRALLEHLKAGPADEFLVVPTQSSIDEVRHHERMPFANAAQELALLVAVGRGWGPHNDNIEECAKTMTTVFFAYCQAFVVEGFPNPAKAAIESMKELGFKL